MPPPPRAQVLGAVDGSAGAGPSDARLTKMAGAMSSEQMQLAQMQQGVDD
jgi:hypothetical protein